MATIKPKTAVARQTLEGFSGIRNAGVFLGADAEDMLNFRIREDGSLEKRCGWKTKFSLPHAIRGLWRGTVGGQSLFFVVSGTTVYDLDPGTAVLTPLLSLSSEDTEVRFCVYLDHLFLLDGEVIYRYLTEENSFRRVFGYVPLLGTDWHPTSGGEWRESMNLLNRYYRVEYYNPGGYKTFYLPYAATLIRVWINGLEDYTFSFLAGTNQFTIQDDAAGKVTVLALSYQPVRTDDILSSTFGEVLTDGKHNALLLGGSRGCTVFVSSPVSPTSAEASAELLEQSDELYFPAENIIYAGDDEHPVKAFCKYHDRLIAFTEENAVSIGYASVESVAPSVVPIDRGIGCSGGTVIAVDGVLYAAHRYGIRRISAPSTHPEDWTVEEIAGAVSDRIADTLAGSPHLAWNRETGELWLCNAESPTETVWIYHPAGKEWYRFDNVFASRFLTLDGQFGFISGMRICLFQNSLRLDDNTSPIVASFRSGYLTLDSETINKRVLSVSLLAAASSQLTLTLESDGRTKRVLFPTVQGLVRPLAKEARFNLVRFRTFRFSISTAGLDRPRVYRITFLAKP